MSAATLTVRHDRLGGEPGARVDDVVRPSSIGRPARGRCARRGEAAARSAQRARPGPSRCCVVVLRDGTGQPRRRSRSRDGDVAAERDERSRPGRLGDLAGGAVGCAVPSRSRRDRARRLAGPAASRRSSSSAISRQSPRREVEPAERAIRRAPPRGEGAVVARRRGDRHRARIDEPVGRARQRPTPHERTRAARRSARPVAPDRRLRSDELGVVTEPAARLVDCVGHARASRASRSPPPCGSVTTTVAVVPKRGERGSYFAHEPPGCDDRRRRRGQAAPERGRDGGGAADWLPSWTSGGARRRRRGGRRWVTVRMGARDGGRPSSRCVDAAASAVNAAGQRRGDAQSRHRSTSGHGAWRRRARRCAHGWMRRLSIHRRHSCDCR